MADPEDTIYLSSACLSTQSLAAHIHLDTYCHLTIYPRCLCMNDRDLCNTYPTSLFFHSSPTGTNRQPHLMTTLTGSINLWPINRSFFNRPLGMNKESRAIAPPGFPSQSRRKLIHSRSMWNFISITLVLANQCKSSQFAIIGFILQFYVYIFSVPHPRTKAI